MVDRSKFRAESQSESARSKVESARSRTESGNRVKKKIEEIFAEVRALPAGGDLDGLSTRKVEELGQLLREEIAAERARWAASNEADFSPSARVSALRPPDDARVGEGAPKRPHVKRRHRV